MARDSVRTRLEAVNGQRGEEPGWRERRIRRLERDVAVVERTSGWINVAVWVIASGVMIYGAVNVTPLLIEHGVLPWTAPGLPLMVDLAICIGLWGDRIMHQYGRTAGWVTALRWITASMTLLLNISGPVLVLDWVGLGIHASGPLLILVVAEAAGAFQRTFAEIVAELHAEIDRQRTAAVSAEADTAETEPNVLDSARGAVDVRDGLPGDARDMVRAVFVSAASGLADDQTGVETPVTSSGPSTDGLRPVARLACRPSDGERDKNRSRCAGDGPAERDC